ncbi:carboxypeptidase-like regulatory domain-containing protein [Pontibacter sp. MBLB2868]|uniref:carboxypeptidase-like regulatory domain-containing protein n=1 Tax=Pontibacter sp. MBLB2868 TaxID=3451555 RepID=UPI003F74F4F7
MRILVTALLCFFAFTLVKAQELPLSGVVTAERNGKPLAYVNIGIRKKNLGTASGAKGEFVLKLPKEHLQDTLTFSAIGYQELSVPVRDLIKTQPLQIKLTEKVNALQEVVVKSRKMKIKKLGVTGRLPGVWGNPENKDGKDVYEFANFINTKDKPTEVLSVHFYLISSKLDSAFFRINFYKNNNGLPGERIVEKSIVHPLSTKEGWVSIDLKKYDIYLTDDFFFGVEYLPAEGADRLAVSLGGKLGGRVYSRQASLGDWGTFVGASLSSYLTARQ